MAQGYSRNARTARFQGAVPQSAAATSEVDPYSFRRKQIDIQGAQREFQTGKTDYAALSSKIEAAKKGELGGSSGMSSLESTGQSAQLGEFNREDTSLQTDAMKDPTKYAAYLASLKEHQATFGEDSPLFLQYGSRITSAERQEQNRMDTVVANDFSTGKLSYTAVNAVTDASTGLNVTAGQQLTGFDAYQAYIADQRSKYTIGTTEYIKYNSLLRQNFYNKSFSDIVELVGTTREGELEKSITDLIATGQYQPNTPQYDALVGQLKIVKQNQLDNAWNQTLTTIKQSISVATSKIDGDLTNLTWAATNRAKVTIDGQVYDFAGLTSDQAGTLFASLNKALTDERNRINDPNSIPPKPKLEINDTVVPPTFSFGTMPGGPAPAATSNVTWTAPTGTVSGLPATNVGATTPTTNAPANSIGGTQMHYAADSAAVKAAQANGDTVLRIGNGIVVIPKNVTPAQQHAIALELVKQGYTIANGANDPKMVGKTKVKVGSGYVYK
jgi:hypothetical protein